MVMNELDQAEEHNWRTQMRRAGQLCAGDHTRLVLAVGGGALLGVLVGMRIGRARGEATGLAKGIELGRLEALSSIPQPQPRRWRPWWPRAA